ncbi:MAG: S1 RNA-binding domain-containing protein [Caldilineaceae bacterium]|nr:S1 RNA-binding domain-containing protein [Caldilineaceae bacterium]
MMSESEQSGNVAENTDGEQASIERLIEEPRSETQLSEEPQSEAQTSEEPQNEAQLSEEPQSEEPQGEAQLSEEPESEAQLNEAQQADEMLFEQYLAEEEDLSLPERGDLREGIVVEVRSNELLVNIGAKRDGIVPQSDLNRLEDDYAGTLREGETVPVVVSKLTTNEGMLVLSIADALQKKDWLVAEKMLESGEITVRKVVGYNKGGLLADFDHLRGFIPASHIVGLPRNMNEEQRNERLQQIVGQDLPVKVIEVERQRRRLVLSYRLAEREYRAGRKAQLFEELAVGAVVDGEVRSLRPFGAFVDIGGADGLLHVSEIGWTPVSHPRDVLKVGEQIQVEVLRLDPERSRIALSRKRLLSNPWESIEERYKVNDTILVTVTRVIDFGAFAQLEPGIEGLIHISELADITVAEPLKMVSSGDRIPVKILRIHPDRQRIGLSRRQADEFVGQELLETEADNLEINAAEEQEEPASEPEASVSEDAAAASIEPEATAGAAEEPASEPEASVAEDAAAASSEPGATAGAAEEPASEPEASVGEPEALATAEGMAGDAEVEGAVADSAEVAEEEGS